MAMLDRKQYAAREGSDTEGVSVGDGIRGNCG